MHIDVRPAQSDDAAPACGVLRRSISECCEQDHRNDDAILANWLGNKTPDTVKSWFQSTSCASMVATVDDQVAGVAVLNRQGKIVLFYVAPERCMAGVGTALLRSVEARAVAWGIRSLQVDSTLTAQAFYLRHGFSVSRKTTTAFGTEALALSKPLAAGSYAGKKPCNCGG